MAVLLFFILLSSPFLVLDAMDTNCPAVKCSPDSPNILFPFSLQKRHPQNCSYPGFKLDCRQNETVIRFPSYGRDLVVKSICYKTKKLSLLDPENCVHGVFLNLNLSKSPFRYYYVVKSYTYLNCSAQLSPPFMQVPCLSGSGYHVYVVEEAFLDMPISCRPVKTIAIPFSYSPYLSDNSFGLGFTWDLTGFEDFQVKPRLMRCFSCVHGKVLSIFTFILMVATLVGVKTYCSNISWVDNLFRSCKSLKHASYTRDDTEGTRIQITAELISGNKEVLQSK
ncbi:RING-H2 finger protein ATL22-like [Diospyros lotus]|uniref:RING-H2 finger protein ATL22-like n=1 Tax=Diospyros lotus TaxID=55363 RepID=UPI00225B38FA|nr:RING-H2 finger protein ATL22-like [Diospyros lotus]